MLFLQKRDVDDKQPQSKKEKRESHGAPPIVNPAQVTSLEVVGLVGLCQTLAYSASMRSWIVTTNVRAWRYITQ